MSRPDDVTIAFRMEATVVLDPLFYDKRWHQELLEDGWTEEGALREMLRESWAEDWTSIIETMTDTHSAKARHDVFADDLVTKVALVHAEDGTPYREPIPDNSRTSGASDA